MPQFILEGAHAPTFAALDGFAQGYIEALFFTDSGPEDGQLGDAGFLDFDPATLAAIVSDCAAFQQTHAALLALAYERDYSEEQAGRDYWFTRCGHGVGYWDRKELEPQGEEYERLTAAMVAARDDQDAWGAALAKRNAIKVQSLGEQLSTAARKAGEKWSTLGDDGKVYVS